MLSNLRFSACLCAFIFLLSGCSFFGDLKVVNRNFEDEIALAQNLVFTFNKDVVKDSDLDVWEHTPYVEIEPKVEGVFKWTAKNELLFSPSAGFEPATKYKANLTKEISKKAKKGSLGGDATFEFRTPYLQLENMEAFWVKGKTANRPDAKLKLRFNYPVNGGEIAQTLQVKVDDKITNFRTEASANNEEMIIALDNAPIEDDALPLEVILQKGIKASVGQETTPANIEQSGVLSSPENLEVLEVKTGFDDNKGYVEIITNQALEPNHLEDIYSIEPNIETETEMMNNGFRIRGSFSESETYQLTLNTKMRDVLGNNLKEASKHEIYFGDMPATLQFTSKKGLYLSSKGNKNVGIQIVNIPKVQVRIAKIYENNILNFVRNSRYSDYDYESESQGGGFTYNTDEQGHYSDEIVNKTIETTNLPKSNGVSVLNMTMPDQNKLKGIYLVALNSNDEYYLNATKLVSVSDIGLITKQSDDGNEIVVFANSIRTAEPLSGVEVNLISNSNQSVYTIKTDGDGVATFKDVLENASGFKIAMITARTNEDFNYLILDDTRVETSRFEVEGKRRNTSGFEAFIYGDRNIYRPGETIHFNTVIRNVKGWESVGEIPVKIRVVMPNGKELKSFLKNTNAQGASTTDVVLDKAAVTGTYSIEVYNNNDVLLASQNVSVEEFMPDRIKVDVSAKENYRTGETVSIAATALNLFGPPAVGRNYEMELSLKRKAFQPKGFESYVFDIRNDANFNNDLRQGKTNEKGLAEQQFIIPATYQDMGVLEGKVYVTVFDETGRPVNRVKRFDVFTQDAFYGIGLEDTYLRTQQSVKIPMVALNPQGKALNTTAQAEIYRIEYQTVVEKREGTLHYSSKRVEKLAAMQNVKFASGKASMNFTPTVSGEYEIRVHRAGAKGASVQSFYAYGWGMTQNTSFEVNNEGQVLMEFDKEKYEVGDKATVLFKTPFAGKLLVTLEKDHILEHHYIETDKKSAEFSFSLDDEHLPNVYVSATLIRGMDDTNMPLTVAHGFHSVSVEKTSTRLNMEIVAVEKSRSKTKQKITVKTNQSNAQLTLAVVDEGILQLKNFRTPDIHGSFYAKQALAVNSHDLYPFLFPEISLANSSTGGDGYDLEKRVNPLSNGRVNLVAFWSGILQTDGSGNATFEVDIPQFSGDLRLMAVGYKDEAFGSASKNMKVADPIVISTGAPRFLSPNDEVIIPVNISNTTKKAAQVTATVQVVGNLAGVGTLSQTLNVPAEQESRTNFSIKANPNIGNGTIVVSVQGMGEKFSEKIELTVRPSTSLLKTSVSGFVQAPQTGTVNLLGDYLPNTTKSTLLLSRSPLTQYANQLDYLLGYPHGCLEQTVSKAFPQIYFGDFARLLAKKSIKRSGENELNPNFNVQAAIQKIETMQLYNGSLSYWHGGDYENWWGTAYATHFLLEAKKAGFEVNPSILSKMMDYLSNKSNEKATDTELLADNTRRTIAKRESIYSLYVLASAGKANRSVMNYYKENPALLSSDEFYLLAGAYSLIGDKKAYARLLPKALLSESNEKQHGGSFSSPIRNMGLVLNTLLETDPNNLQIPALARQLSQALRSSPYLNTQESAFAFLSLGKIAKKAAASDASATVSGGGKVLGNFVDKDVILPNILNQELKISTKGKGAVYYFAEKEGISTTGKYVEEDKFLRVRRTFYTRSGKVVSNNQFRQNDLIVVRVSVFSTNGLPVENVVVTDMLPAGFEIENPRITEDREMAWIKNQSSPQYFDIRDDRVNYYTTADNTEKAFYYLVRAVSKGKFLLGPASADAMYNAEYRSYSGGGSVKVE